MDRRTFAACLAAAPVALAFGSHAVAAERKSGGRASDAAQAAQIISQIRQANGLPAVSADSKLTAAAQHQARSVAAAGRLDHGDFAGRVRSFGIRGAVAENLAYGTNDVAGAIAQWQGSSAHYANLLLPGASRIGIAHADTASTRYWAMVIG